MTPSIMILLAGVVLATSFLSGIFGMAGGLILIGVLLVLLPVQDAMALHGITQTASNGWRALLWWRFIRFRSAAGYILGCCLALIVWAMIKYVPDKAVAMLMLGLTPFIAQRLPRMLKPNAQSLAHGIGYGAACMSLLVLTGVVGPLVDMFFLGGTLERREIVATKAFCQVFGHVAKFIYFGMLIDQVAQIDLTLAAIGVACALIGTTVARRFLEGMSDVQFRTWTGRIIVTVSLFYIGQGTYLLAVPVLKAAVP